MFLLYIPYDLDFGSLHNYKTGTYNRDLVRAGATGASAPAKIWWRVRRTRPKGRELMMRKSFLGTKPQIFAS